MGSLFIVIPRPKPTHVGLSADLPLGGTRFPTGFRRGPRRQMVAPEITIWWLGHFISGGYIYIIYKFILH